MKQGKSIVELAQEIERRRQSMKDFIVPTNEVVMTPDTNLVFRDQNTPVTPFAHAQIAAQLGIAKPYYDKMRVEAPELLANNVNVWFQKYPKARMIRTLDGQSNAYLSDKYRRMDNFPLASAVLPALGEIGVDVVSSEITETKFYLKVVDYSVRKDIPKGGFMGDGQHNIFSTMSPAMVLSNSEVGNGGLSIQTSVWEKACTNLTVFKERSLRKTHVGARHEITEGYMDMLSDETLRVTDEALWRQVTDVVKGAFDRARFDALCDQIAVAAGQKIEGKVEKSIELAAVQFGFNGDEQGSILRHLINGGDLSRWGLSSAITRASQDVDSYDRATEMEKAGGAIVEMAKGEWQELAHAA